MTNSKIALFFSLLFLSFIATPTVISILDLSYDTTLFFNINEEENNNHNEIKKVEFDILNWTLFSAISKFKTSAVNSDFYLNNYASFFIEHKSPPPERLC